MTYEFATSLSGHDKGQTYLIWKKEGSLAYLVNGTTRTVERPKKKNERHYQAVKRIPDEISEQLNQQRPLTDEIIRRAVKAYDQSISRRQKECQKQTLSK